MTTPRVYRFDDPGAPQLTGQLGAVLAILQQCLVGTAGVAYGTGAHSKVPAGWSSPFTNTVSKAVFRNSLAAGGTGCFVRVLDDGSGAAGYREAFMAVYGTMTDIDTGSGITPPVALAPTAINIRKSETLDGALRPWLLYADECTFYLYVDSNVTALTAASQYQQSYVAGDYISFSVVDPSRYLAAGRITPNTAGNAADGGFVYGVTPQILTTVSVSKVFVATDATLTGESVQASPWISACGGRVMCHGTLADPTPGVGTRVYDNVTLIVDGAPKGKLRGAYQSYNSSAANIAPGAPITVVDSGESFAMVGLPCFSPHDAVMGAFFVDISNAWGQ